MTEFRRTVSHSRIVHMGRGADELIKDAIRVDERPDAVRPRSTFTAYAAPMAWGPDVTVASHIGSVTYTIQYDAVGDTLVQGQVRYFKGPGGGQLVTELFQDETTITTADAVANVICCFKGVPTGSAVNGTVS